MRGKQKCSLGGSRIWTLSWDNKSRQQGYWSFKDQEESVTEVEVPPGAGQWPGEIMLKRLARYAPNDYFIFGPGTWREREDREAGSTVQEENNLSILY
jgi:hypothetical protein